MRKSAAVLATGLLFAAFFSACSSNAVRTVTPTVVPTAVGNTPSPNLTPTTNVLDATPTQTVGPTSTPAPSTPAPTATLAPAATPTLTIQFVDNADCSEISHERLPTTNITIQQAELGVSVIAEIATSQSEQAQGLMCREVVQEGSGMLFVFETDRSGGFWMFNTYAPLDIIYFGGQDGGVSIKQMAPCPRNVEEEDAVWRSRCSGESSDYRPNVFYRNALELPQGWLEDAGFDLSQPSDITVSID